MHVQDGSPTCEQNEEVLCMHNTRVLYLYCIDFFFYHQGESGLNEIVKTVGSPDSRENAEKVFYLISIQHVFQVLIIYLGQSRK